jgi:hypothetical protein
VFGDGILSLCLFYGKRPYGFGAVCCALLFLDAAYTLFDGFALYCFRIIDYNTGWPDEILKNQQNLTN